MAISNKLKKNKKHEASASCFSLLKYMKHEFYAVINTNWKKKGWENPFLESTMAAINTEDEDISVLAIFPNKEEAQNFLILGKLKNDKIIKLKVVV